MFFLQNKDNKEKENNSLIQDKLFQIYLRFVSDINAFSIKKYKNRISIFVSYKKVEYWLTCFQSIAYNQLFDKRQSVFSFCFTELLLPTNPNKGKHMLSTPPPLQSIRHYFYKSLSISCNIPQYSSDDH